MKNFIKNNISIILILILLIGFAVFYEHKLNTFDKNAQTKFKELTEAKELAEKKVATLEEPLIILNELWEKRLEQKEKIKTHKDNIKRLKETIQLEKEKINNANINIHDIETRIRCNRTKSYTEIDCDDKNILKDFS